MGDRPGRSGNVPPAEHRFKPGQSGNPKGRPKDTARLQTLVEEELRQTLEVDGRSITKMRALARAIVAHAMKGHPVLSKELMNRLWPADAAPLVEVNVTEQQTPAEKLGIEIDSRERIEGVLSILRESGVVVDVPADE